MKHRVSIFLIFALILLPGAVLAQELSYDPYAQNFPEIREDSRVENAGKHFLVYPFEILRWPIDKILVALDEYHVPKKMQWGYDLLDAQGITPRVSLGRLGAGVDVDMVRLVHKKGDYPDLIAKGKVYWAHDVVFDVGTEIGLQRIAGDGLHTSASFQYDDRPEEHFYGIGPDTSRGEGSSYNMERTQVDYNIGYDFSPLMGVDLKVGYVNVNIKDGEDGGRGVIPRTFAPGSIPGLTGDDLVSVGIVWDRDSRNLKALSTEGGYGRLGLSFVEGVQSSRARYLRYQAEVSRYLSLGSPRRVLAVHAYAEHNDEVNDGIVPFHQMAKLGGYGTYPRLGHPLRAYDFNRFFDESILLLNVEYRYTIWEYNDFKIDALLSWDEGQVFGEFSDLQLRDFRESYGLGFRLSLANNILFSVEMNHGDEGTNFYVKSATPF
ncbi:MAG: BamA/TamA family outer membrane protein [Candidatus Omnitrophota bacterium]|nr:BamA/TamA family outer membrane protein [Candidatus Omnitrophota bacterium]